MSTMPAHAGVGDLKQRVCRLVEADPQRYAAAPDRHKRLTVTEIEAVAQALGVEPAGTRPATMAAVMRALGREHRTGVQCWDSSDLHAVIDALEGAR